MARILLPTVALLLLSTITLSACGGEDADLLPGRTAGEINANLDAVRQLSDEGDCLGAESAAQQVGEQIEAIEGIDPRLKRALSDGAVRLREVVGECEEESESEEEPPAEEEEFGEEEGEEEEPEGDEDERRRGESGAGEGEGGGKADGEPPHGKGPEGKGPPGQERTPPSEGPSENETEPPSGGLEPGQAVEGGSEE